MSELRFNFIMRPSAQDLTIRAVHGEEAFKRRMWLVMGREGHKLVKLSKEEAPKKTGAYARSIRHETYQHGDVTGFKITSARPLGKWIQEGTRPHIIRARNVSHLRFFWARGPKGPGVYYFRQVNHPGTKPNPFYRRAIMRWKPGARTEVILAANEFAQALAGK